MEELMQQNLSKPRINILRIFLPLVLVCVLAVVAYFIFQKVVPGKNSAPGKTYDANSFSQDTEQILAPGDALKGKGVAGAKVTVLISPGGESKDVDVNENGEWSYQLDQNIQERKYRVTITLYDTAGKFLNIKSYPIKIVASKKTSDASVNSNVIQTAYAQNSCNLQPEYHEYDCSNGKKWWNDWTVGVSSCTLIPLVNSSGRNNRYDVEEVECAGRGTGWKGDPLTNTSSTTGCGTMEQTENQTCEEVAHFAPGEYCYTDYYRDESTQCRWEADPSKRIQRCGRTVDPSCKAQPRDERPRTYELLQDHYPTDVYENEKKDWEKWLQSMDLFPVWSIEDEQEVIIDRETFEQELCNGRACFF